MVVGILSDSHDRQETLTEAMRVLARAGAESFFHCGDVGGQHVFEELVGRPCWFVWGNTDFPTDGLLAFVEGTGLRLMDSRTGIELAGKRITVWHGHEPGFLPSVRSGTFDYVFYGHTHAKDDRREGNTRLINPGALHRTRVKTVATLDLATDVLTYHEVPST